MINKIHDPVHADFEIKEGVTFEFECSFYNKADNTDHSLAGYSAIELTIKTDRNAGSEVATPSLTDGLSVSTNKLTASKDISWGAGKYYYDAIGINADSKNVSLMYGSIRVADAAETSS